MEGTIIRGVGGFYYVHDGVSCIYACKARGIFRNRQEKPLVGDRVFFEVTDPVDREGNVTEILPRHSELIRPAVANVDQVLLLFALRRPAPNMNLLDRFLLMMSRQNIPVILVWNKTDLAPEEDWETVEKVYRDAGCPLLRISVTEGRGIEGLRSVLREKTTVLAGPSGVGKSSLTNLLHPQAAMETGTLSRKIQRGRQTTRHSELFFLEEKTFLMDTPGFTSLDVFAGEPEEVRDGTPEFALYRKDCRFLDCMHIGENDCAVKRAVSEGLISPVRYENYCQMVEEVRRRKKY